ncbi:hypothetical protein Tco_0661817, partial [Tanacetum coccineum]
MPVQYETEKALRNNQVYNWKTAKYGKISWRLDIKDINCLRFFETKFSAIVYDDALKLELDFSSDPTLCSQHVNKVNWKNKTSLAEYDGEKYNEEQQEYKRRLAKIYYRKIHRVHVLDFARLSEINEGDAELDMTERLRMEHMGDDGDVL